MKRTLVTGAAGFTGHYIGEVLASRNHELHALVHNHDGSRLGFYEHLHEADLGDQEELAKIVHAVQPDYVIHLAAIAFVAHDDIAEMYQVNVVGTRNLLSALSSLGSPPSAILLASSANVYGNGSGGVLDETAPLAPVNDYAVTKVAMEYVAAIFRRSLPLITARPFNYSGRGQSSQFVIPKIVDHARSRSPTIELGNLDVARDFSDVRTIADAYARLISKEGAIGGTFNICSGRSVTLREILELVAKISGHELVVRVNPALVRANDVRSLRGSRARIEQLIGPLRQISLEDTLRWMLDA